MKVKVLDIKGQETGRQVDLPDGLFGVEPNEHALYLASKQYQAHNRQGTSKSRERGEVRGSTRKIKKQKGTGTARAGSIKNPLFRGGGRVFGPQPRDYFMKLNKKLKSLARISALSVKAKNNEIVVLEDFSFDKPQTNAYNDMLKNLNAQSIRSLHIIGEYDKNLNLSMRNIPKTSLMVVKDINTYEILKAKKIILSESSIQKMNDLFV
jgi:large subunit ribosomal protein L4